MWTTKGGGGVLKMSIYVHKGGGGVSDVVHVDKNPDFKHEM